MTTTDRLTDGRLELGLGTGYTKSEFEDAGIPFESAGRRVEHLRTTVATISALLSDASHQPGPAQRRIPILLAGNGDKMLRLAAESADIVGFTGASTDREGRMSFNTAADLESRVQFAREAAGDRADDIEWNLLVQTVRVTDDRDGMTTAEFERLEPALTIEEFAALPSVLIGTAHEIADKLIDVRRRTGLSYFTVLQDHLDDFAHVIGTVRRS